MDTATTKTAEREYPFADAAVLVVEETPQTCAVCGQPILLANHLDFMTFDTRPNPDAEGGSDILTLHGACDPR